MSRKPGPSNRFRSGKIRRTLSRRQLLQAGAAAGAGMFLLGGKWPKRAVAQIPGGTLPPGDVAKFQLPLVKPPAMPRSLPGRNPDYYQIAVREFDQQILSPPHPMTRVWSYGSVDYPGTVLEGGTFNYPAFTIEAHYNFSTVVNWINQLVDGSGNYLPHLLPVDPTLHWANPPGGIEGRDTRPLFDSTPGPYLGPVPIVTHVHGAHTYQESDGYPEAWYLPAAGNIPADFATTGTFYDLNKVTSPFGGSWGPGSAVFEYPNNQRATTLWYHDHTLGMTRLNVYAGPAGFYLIRGGPDDKVLTLKGKDAMLPGPAPGPLDNPFGEYGEIPIVIQDRSFNADGSLFYPGDRAFFDGFPGPYIPDTPVSPIWNPEFFGNMMVVNGSTWPYLDVSRRRYRFRFLNGCNSRFLILQFSDPNVKVWQIGAEGGFLPAPVDINAVNGGMLLIAPAERADVIVDFADASNEVLLYNLGPDEPFGGGLPGVDFNPADPASTGQVTLFRVMGGKVNDKTTPPQDLKLPAISPLGPAGNVRAVSLNEEVYAPADVPYAALLGTLDGPKLWKDGITEDPAAGATEVWEMYNFTEDAHPIHIHLVQFQVVGREAIGGGPSIAGSNGPLPTETGFKDTVIAYPGEITRVIARFDIAGLFVWHCHIVEHEDNEMMRPYAVG